MSKQEQVLERRPLASRQWRASAWAAGRMASAGISANAISVAGMAAGIAAGVALWATSEVESGGIAQRALWVAAALLVQARLIANLLDGMVAIERGVASRVGGLYNEIPDRVSDAATLIGLGSAFGGSVMAGFIAALLAVFTAYVRAAVKVAGAPQDYCGPMAKQQRMFAVTVACVLCALIPLAWQSWNVSDWTWTIPQVTLWIIAAGCVVTVIRRLKRAATALRGNEHG